MTTPLAPLGQAPLLPPQLARKAMKTPALLKELIAGLDSDTSRARYGYAKALSIVAEESPARLYPYFDSFVRLLDHPNKILQWEASFGLSHLACVDTQNRFAPTFGKYFSPIAGPVMVTAANVIRNSSRIARANPQLADRIAAEVLKVGEAQYQTPECRNVAIGHAILTFGEILDLLKDPAPVIEFVRKQLKNTRPATRKKAEQCLKSAETRGIAQTDARSSRSRGSAQA